MAINAQKKMLLTATKQAGRRKRSLKSNCFQKIALGLLFSGILTFSQTGKSFALDRFLTGTYGNGIPIGGKTVEEARAYLEGDYSQNYVLYLIGR